jgi:hypothetical protein
MSGGTIVHEVGLAAIRRGLLRMTYEFGLENL